jgi:hypothetical protein
MRSHAGGIFNLVDVNDSRIHQLAAEIRADGDLDAPDFIASTAARYGVTVTYAEIGLLWGVTFGNAVVISSNERFSARDRLFIFGHELGHVLVGRGRMPWAQRCEERFCDALGAALVSASAVECQRYLRAA